MMKLVALAACSALVVAGFSSPTKANTFDFTFESNAMIIASGQITTAGPFVMGQAPVTGITGSYNGFPITGLLPNNTAGFQTNNILYEADPFVDVLGIIFSTSNDGTVANIFHRTNANLYELGSCTQTVISAHLCFDTRTYLKIAGRG